ARARAWAEPSAKPSPVGMTRRWAVASSSETAVGSVDGALRLGAMGTRGIGLEVVSERGGRCPAVAELSLAKGDVVGRLVAHRRRDDHRVLAQRADAVPAVAHQVTPEQAHFVRPTDVAMRREVSLAFRERLGAASEGRLDLEDR